MAKRKARTPRKLRVKLKTGRLSREQIKNPATKIAYNHSRDSFSPLCRQCSNKKMQLLAIANHNLWEILLELDRTDPIEGVVLSHQMVHEVVKALKTGERHVKLANIIAAQARQCDQTFQLLLRQLEHPQEGSDT